MTVPLSGTPSQILSATGVTPISQNAWRSKGDSPSSKRGSASSPWFVVQDHDEEPFNGDEIVRLFSMNDNGQTRDWTTRVATQLLTPPVHLAVQQFKCLQRFLYGMHN